MVSPTHRHLVKFPRLRLDRIQGEPKELTMDLIPISPSTREVICVLADYNFGLCDNSHAVSATSVFRSIQRLTVLTKD